MFKKIFIGMLLVFALWGSAIAENRRSLLYFWEENVLHLTGNHRPYSRIIVEENGESIGETVGDSRGAFSLRISINAEVSHHLFARAFDHFGQEVQEANGEADLLEIFVPPATRTSGKILGPGGSPVMGAEVRLMSAEGVLLNRTFANDNGEYDLSGIPHDGRIVVSGKDFSETSFLANAIPKIISLEFSSPNSPAETKVFEPTSVSSSPILSPLSPTASFPFFWIWGVLGSVLMVIVGILLWKRFRKN